MTKRIKMALWLAKAFQVLLIILLGLFVVFTILILAKSNITENYVFELSNNADIFQLYECVDCQEDGSRFYAHKLQVPMFLSLFLQLVITLFCLYRISQEVVRILHNFQNRQTFYQGNITSFRTMGKFALFLAVALAIKVVAYNNLETGYELSNIRVRLPLAEIAFALVCYVLADVFAQGKELKEENESIL